MLVDEAFAGRGLGHDLHARCLAAHSERVTDVRTRVYDGDETAMAVARHWGYESVQLSITSRVELVGRHRARRRPTESPSKRSTT